MAVAGGSLLESKLSYCPGCDFGYFHPTPSRSFLAEFYRGGGGVDDTIPEASRLRSLDGASFQAESIQVISMMQLSGIDLSAKNGGRVLEIGPGYACYARIFQTFGMEYWANEPGQGSAGFLARNFGASILETDLEQIPPDFDATFDLVFSKDSFEHHPDPLASVRRCCRLLRPGGHLVITVPNLHSRSFKAQSVMHPYFAFPPHLNYFSRRSLERILSSEGLQDIASQTFSFPIEIHYCMELGIKLGSCKPEGEYLDELSASDGHERLFVVARRPPS